MKIDRVIVKENMTQSESSFWWRKKEVVCKAPAPKPGELCPTCDEGLLSYDGLFVLICSHCGKAAESGAFT
jgi:predicted amidophosphoribosyltransferase